MKEFGAIAMLITLVVTVTIGVKLILAARRTGELPELLFGLAFVCGGLGQGFGQIGRRALWADAGDTTLMMNTICFGIVVAGMIALWVAVWRVFRPEHRIGSVIAGVGMAMMLVGYGMRIGTGELGVDEGYGNGMRLFLFARISLFCWITTEAFHHSQKVFKRARLGLADVMTAHQIRMWGVAGGANMLLTILIAVYTIELGRSPLEDFWAVWAILAMVSVSVITMWIAFFPPAGLAARWRRSAEPSSSPGAG